MAIEHSFSIPEKLSLVKLIYTTIIADRIIHEKEIQFFTDLSHMLDFNLGFIQKAKKMDIDQSLAILDELEKDKKELVGKILKDMAMADGFIDDQEMSFLINIFNTLGIDPALV